MPLHVSIIPPSKDQNAPAWISSQLMFSFNEAILSQSQGSCLKRFYIFSLFNGSFGWKLYLINLENEFNYNFFSTWWKLSRINRIYTLTLIKRNTSSYLVDWIGHGNLNFICTYIFLFFKKSYKINHKINFQNKHLSLIYRYGVCLGRIQL